MYVLLLLLLLHLLVHAAGRAYIASKHVTRDQESNQFLQQCDDGLLRLASRLLLLLLLRLLPQTMKLLQALLAIFPN